MCRCRCLLPVLVCAAATRTLAAQSGAQLQTRADSLAREWRRANAVADAVDSLERARALAGRDTIRVGALTIVANPSPLPLREAATRAWPALDSLYGTAARQLEGRPYVIAAFDPDTTVERPAVRGALQVPQNDDVASLALILLMHVPMAPLDTALQGWLGGSVRPTIRPEQQRAAVYVQLVTAPSGAARSCFVGEAGGCLGALDLIDGPEDLERWYPSQAERRALVTRSFAEYFGRGARQPTLRLCAEGSDAACAELLRLLPPGALPRPLGYDARETLVHIALRHGGRDAYQRLIATPRAPIADRLASAAGMSIDTLVSRWRGEILASRPKPVALPPWGVWAALGWTAVFAACGLRSSRWRVT
jgi:hypothetical protein